MARPTSNRQHMLTPLRCSLHTFSMTCMIMVLLTLAACAPGSGILGAGGQWQAASLPAHHLRTLLVDAQHPDTVYTGDTNGTIFVSTDGGTHWTARSHGLPSSASLCQLASDTTGKQLYATTTQGLFVSTDAAQHWQAIGAQELPVDRYTALAFDPHAASIRFVGTAHHGVFRSTDAGESWTALDGLSPQTQINALTFDSDQQQLWAATSTGIYRWSAQNGGWTASNTGLPSSVVVNTLQLATTTGGIPGLLYAGTTRGFFLSQDGGRHWTMGQEGTSTLNVRAILPDFRTSKSTTLYIGTSNGVLRSDDSGQTWSTAASGLQKNTTVYALALGAEGYTQLFAAADALYLSPGSSGSLNFSQLLAIAAATGFFIFLLRIANRDRRRQLRVPPPRPPRVPPPAPPDAP